MGESRKDTEEREQMRMAKFMTPGYHPVYYIDCLSCNLYRKVRERPFRCPKCNASLHERRILQ